MKTISEVDQRLPSYTFGRTIGMEPIEIDKTTYGLVRNFKHDTELRTLFNSLTQATYGFDFEFWHEAGFWGNQYIPYSLKAFLFVFEEVECAAYS